MASIDEVIARSRQPGGFTEKKSFSVARQRGIRKMREFALADPHYYVLELIQAAVANGARNVDLRVEAKEFGLSYVGGGFAEQELAQIFDFLFTSKDRVEHADIRQLALGVNALMYFEPETIVIESGDGTLERTTRIEIRGQEDTVDVGTPKRALRGTFVRATGLNRRVAQGWSFLGKKEPGEFGAIEGRCLAAPVPIVVNDDPIFGYSTVRTPNVFGYDDVVSFDEGDLYGTIGRAKHSHKRFIKAMTWGTWITSIEAPEELELEVGGVVNFDGFNKTADHAGIVEDEQLAQFWERLKPYIDRVRRGQSGMASFDLRALDGAELAPREVRELLQSRGNAVVVPMEVESGDPRAEVAREVAEALGAVILRVEDADLSVLEHLVVEGGRLVRPDLSGQRDLEFFGQAPVEPASRPWLTGVREVSWWSVGELAGAVVAEEASGETRRREGVGSEAEGVAELEEVFGRQGVVGVRIYTPMEGDASALRVRVLSMDRLVWEGAVDSMFPGHVLDLEVPAMSPTRLREAAGLTGASLAERVAHVAARHLDGELAEASARAIEAIQPEQILPGSVAARLLLAAVARSGLLRLRRDAGAREVRLSLTAIDDTIPAAFRARPLLSTTRGEGVSVEDLPAMMARQGGLLYGVVDGVRADLAGLDDAALLALDRGEERLLETIVGPGAYIRVDGRDVIASADGVQVRDIAFGLRAPAPGDLLVEGQRAGRLPEETVRELVSQLVRVVIARPGDSEHISRLRMQRLVGEKLDLDRLAEPPAGAFDHPRQALMHLQYFLLSRWGRAPTWGVEKLPLFVSDRAEAVDLEALAEVGASQGALVMLDGRAVDVVALGVDVGRERVGPPPVCSGLSMSPWLLGLLDGVMPVELTFDFDLTEAEARARGGEASRQALLFEAAVEAAGVSGVVGIPAQGGEDEMVAVIERGHARVHPMREPSNHYGVVGYVRVEEGEAAQRWDQILGAVERAGQSVLRAMLAELEARGPGLAHEERILEVLFAFTAGHVTLERRPDGVVHPLVNHPLADAVLDVPLLKSRRGTPVSAQRVLQEFCRRESLPEAVAAAELVVESIPAAVRGWMGRLLRVERIRSRRGDRPVQPQPVALMSASELDRLDDIEALRGLERWLDYLRPDMPEPRSRPQAGPADADDAQGFEPGLSVGLFDPAAPGEFVGVDHLESVWSELGGAWAMREALSSEQPYGLWSAGRPVVLINRANEVWAAFRRGAQPADERLAWMLLSLYAFLNEVRAPVTNDHELAFQRRVSEALVSGEFASPDPKHEGAA